MLHTAEVSCDIADILIRGQPFDREDGCHVVFHIVQAGNFDLLLPHDGYAVAPDHAVPEARTVRRDGLPREHPDLSGGFRCKPGRDGVVRVQDEHVLRGLPGENMFFCVDVLRHVAVYVEMVRRKVRHDGDVAAVAKVHKLERAQLQHDEVVRRHVFRLIEQRRTDIAAGPDAIACMLQDFGDKRACRRFAV